MEQGVLDIIEFLPDATFVIDREKRIIAWNRACEEMTCVKREEVLGKGDYAYAEPFFGERRPILIDLLDAPSPGAAAGHERIQRSGDTIYAESFNPRLNGGQGIHLWGAAAPLFDSEGRRWGAIEVLRDVTEQKRVEHALRESELKYRTLFDSAGDGILLMRRNRFIDCNARALAMFGCSREQIIGAPPYEFSPPTQRDGRSSEEKAIEKINLALVEGPQCFEWEHSRIDGTPFAAEVSLNRLELDGEVMLQAIVRDIAKKKEEEARIRRMATVVKDSNDAITIQDFQGRITAWNHGAELMYGYGEEEALQMNIECLTPADKKEEQEELTGRLIAGEAITSLETQRVTNDGRILDVWMTITKLVDDTGKPIGIASTERDITERKRNEEEIRSLNIDLEKRVQERTAELAAVNMELESFSRTVSHDLRAPLRRIDGWSLALLEDYGKALDSTASGYLDTIRSEAQSMAELIETLLHLSRVTRGEMVRQGVDLGDVARAIEKDLRQAAPGHDVEFVVAPDVRNVEADPRLVRILLENLLGNAWKFTRNREHPRVELGVYRKESRIIYFARDNGAGFDMAFVERLFQPFQRLHSSDDFPGTGVGLATVQRIVHRHGGTIWAEGEVGKGATFYFTLGGGEK